MPDDDLQEKRWNTEPLFRLKDTTITQYKDHNGNSKHTKCKDE
jgi:hypothetical protein